MPMQTRIHCLIDREPASYHDQLRCAVNLNLECEGEAADEPEAERQFERFLAALPDVQFHVYVLSGSGDVQDATYVAGPLPAIGQATLDPQTLMNWLRARGQDAANPFWTLPADVAPLLDHPEQAVDAAQIRATHLLRGSHAWSAPVAHQFGLTRLAELLPAMRPDAAILIMLPHAPGHIPNSPLQARKLGDGRWDVVYPFNTVLGDVVCRVNKIAEADVQLPEFLDADGYLLVNSEAENVRRLLDWFERGWAGLLSGLPSTLAAPGAPTVADLFEPTWREAADQVALDAPAAAWRIVAGLATALDPIVVALMRPSRQGGPAGELLLPLVNDILDAAQDVPIQKLYLTSAAVTAAVRQVLAKSPLLDPATPIRRYLTALRVIHDIETEPSETDVALKLCNQLVDAIGDNGKFTSPILTQQAAAALAQQKDPLRGFLVDPYQVVTEATHRLHEEAGAEAVIVRIFDSATNGRTFPALLWDALHPHGAPAAGTDPDIDAFRNRLDAIWEGFVGLLRSPFNGEEAARRSASADFLDALLEAARQPLVPWDASSRPPSAALLKDHLQRAALFPLRCLNTGGPDTFASIVTALPRTLPFLLEPASVSVMQTWLADAYADMLTPADQWVARHAVFRCDDAPAPLPIQVSALLNADELDLFSKNFNGICVAVRRLDNPGAPDSNRWAHAHLAELNFHGTQQVTGLRQWLPAAHDQRAPMFIDYEGFPFSSRTIGRVGTPSGAADAMADVVAPFYASDEPDFAMLNAGASTWHPVPRLVYGRQFEAFSFATTNSGSLPRALQADAAPWTPKPAIAAPVARFETAYQRRTAVGAVALQETVARGAAARIDIAINGVQPLSADYPRIALASVKGHAQSVDLLRESDGSGMLAFPAAGSTQDAVRVELADFTWQGSNATRFALTFHDTATLADAIEPLQVQLGTTAPQPAGAGISIALTHDRTFVVRIGNQTETVPVDRDSTWWLRLTLESENTCIAFADPRGRGKAGGQGASLLLMAPDGDVWSDKRLAETVRGTIASPRVGFLDFERWFANTDLLARTFAANRDAGDRLLDSLLLAYLRRNEPLTDRPMESESIAAFLDRLPDPAVDTLLVELVCVDALGDVHKAAFAETLDIRSKLANWAAHATMELEAITLANLRQNILGTLHAEQWFSFEITSQGNALNLVVQNDHVIATVPAGVVAELRVSALVSTDHFTGMNGHPSVFHPGVKQLGHAHGDKTWVFPGAALRIETMVDGLPDLRPQALADQYLYCAPNPSAREYALVAGSTQTANRNPWRLIGEVSVSTQRWRPDGRPIYNLIDPGKCGDPVPGAAAVPVKPGSAPVVSVFEQEIFDDRADEEVETIWKRLEPMPPATGDGTLNPAARPAHTILQSFPLESPAATYLRHRYQLRSRYAGALHAGNSHTQPAWAEQNWNQRVMMLADRARVLITRPQLRALIPLTTSPHARATPPIVAYLQEPPFAEGGLADRIASELKLGFGFGFNQPSDATPTPRVGILDARKEFGGDPRLTYERVADSVARGLVLATEGPVGLTFDTTGTSAAGFANSIISMVPENMAGASDAVFEEHFLGIAMRRYLDPAWLTQDTQRESDALEGFDCHWIDYDPELTANQVLLACDNGQALLTVVEEEAPPAVDDPLIARVEPARLCLAVSTLAIDKDGAAAGRHTVTIARLPDEITCVSVLHVPIAKGRYSASIFVVRKAPDIARGQSNQPVLLASFEWSPRQEGTTLRDVKLIAQGGTTRRCVASAPTFLAWSRTMRDFNYVEVVPDQDATSGETSVASEHLALQGDGDQSPLRFRARQGDNTWKDVLPRATTLASRFPIHVHRHLAVLGTRRAPGLGKTLEVFSGSALIGPLAAGFPQLGDLARATHIRVMEVESPAWILGAAFRVDAGNHFVSGTAIPVPYATTYVDFLATDASWGRAFKIFMRFVGPQSHLSKFSTVHLRLERPDALRTDANGTTSNVPQGELGRFALPLQQAAQGTALGAEIVLTPVADGTVLGNACLVFADGTRSGVVASVSLKPGADDAGFLLSIAAPDAGEFWTDFSVLHFGAAHAASLADGKALPFDFDLLLSGTPSGLAASEAVLPGRLADLHEVQARIVAVSPAIPVMR